MFDNKTHMQEIKIKKMTMIVPLTIFIFMFIFVTQSSLGNLSLPVLVSLLVGTILIIEVIFYFISQSSRLKYKSTIFLKTKSTQVIITALIWC